MSRSEGRSDTIILTRVIAGCQNPALKSIFAQAILSGLIPAARGEDGSTFLTDPNWKATFLNEHQNETLISLSDVIIPATETQARKKCRSIAIFDLLLSVGPVSFSSSLSRLWPSSTKKASAVAFKVVRLHFSREHDRERTTSEISRRSFEAPVPF
jgi:hypothetical protein